MWGNGVPMALPVNVGGSDMGLMGLRWHRQGSWGGRWGRWGAEMGELWGGGQRCGSAVGQLWVSCGAEVWGRGVGRHL